jgi:hypothetical protein
VLWRYSCFSCAAFLAEVSLRGFSKGYGNSAHIMEGATTFRLDKS